MTNFISVKMTKSRVEWKAELVKLTKVELVKMTKEELVNIWLS